MNRVVIRLMEDGSLKIYTDEPCEVFSVDETAPSGRVYRLTYDEGALMLGGIDDVLADDVPGTIGDGSAAEIKIVNYLTGGPRLVSSDTSAPVCDKAEG